MFNTISGLEDWHVNELPRDKWSELFDHHREDDTFAVLVSGEYSNPRMMHNVSCYAGMDQLVNESSPRTDEPEGNAYHFVLIRSGHPKHPYILMGPIPSGTQVSHWFNYEDLSVYWD
jgi:hypothetical protein